MHAGKITKKFRTRGEEGIPSASFFYNGMEAERFCEWLADLAEKSLICEVDATPKPGLVDRENSGAHNDMDRAMFLRSARALRGFFRQCAEIGAACGAATEETFAVNPVETPANNPAKASEAEPRLRVLAGKLRRAGLQGEAAMYAVTGGVNTHKGLIFSLGILCAACGIMAGSKSRPDAGLSPKDAPLPGDTPPSNEMPMFDEADLQRTCARIAKALFCGQTRCGDAEERDEAQGAERAVTGTEPTHGQLVFQRTGIGGIKEEAASGFSTAFEKGLPQLRKALSEGASMNDALVETLLHLLAETDDSNVVYRGGREGLEFVQDRARALLQSGEPVRSQRGLEAVRTLDREFTRRNLSPGGCADLLAITAMLYFVTASAEV